MKVKGLEQLRARFDQLIEQKRREIFDLRGEMARELTTALVKNIPVWSGRTVASLVWGAAEANTIQPHPQRGGFDINGQWRASEAYGPTQSMPMGSEPMRASAEAHATAQAAAVQAMTGSTAVLTIHSVPWSMIERGAAPGLPSQRPRNTAVVSEIALAQVRARFSGNVK